MNKLDGITVSVGYGDFLAWSLPFNRNLFDRLVVVTTPEDKYTQDVCNHYYVECLQTDIFYKDGQKFNKGLGINYGLEKLDFPDWCIHFDADVVFPPRAKEFLNKGTWNEQYIYGVDRLMVPNDKAWFNFLNRPCSQSHGYSSWPIPFGMGYRVVWDNEGYLPIGYCQMFNRNSVYLKDPLYPTKFDTAADSDIHFAKQWPRSNRELIKEFFVYHLDSELDATGKNIGANWEGRKTPKFGF